MELPKFGMSGWSKNFNPLIVVLLLSIKLFSTRVAHMFVWLVKIQLSNCNFVFNILSRFNIQSKEKEAELKGHEDAVLDICFDNGKEGMLISASSDCSFRIW